VEYEVRYDDALIRPADEQLLLTVRNLLCGYLSGTPNEIRAREIVDELDVRLGFAQRENYDA
jgi:hypothetical protein